MFVGLRWSDISAPPDDHEKKLEYYKNIEGLMDIKLTVSPWGQSLSVLLYPSKNKNNSAKKTVLLDAC